MLHPDIGPAEDDAPGAAHPSADLWSHAEVTCWVDRAAWGRGNAGSLRVLQNAASKQPGGEIVRTGPERGHRGNHSPAGHLTAAPRILLPRRSSTRHPPASDLGARRWVLGHSRRVLSWQSMTERAERPARPAARQSIGRKSQIAVNARPPAPLCADLAHR